MSRISIDEVAKIANVSKSTVSRVLNNYPNSGISQHTRQIVIDAAKRLKFVPHLSAAALSGKKTHIIGALIIDANNPFAGGFISKIEEVIQDKGYHLILCNTRGNSERVRQESNLLIQRGIEGLIIEHVGNPGYLRDLHDNGCFFVLLDRCPEYPGFSYVTNDDTEGGRLATQALIDVGRTKIAHISGPLHFLAMQDRQKGYLKALQHADYSMNARWIINLSEMQSHNQAESAAGELFDSFDRPDGFFCSSDYFSLGVLRAAEKRGLKAGKDFSLIGYNDEAFCPWVSVPLASVRLDMERVGQNAANLLLEKIKNNDIDLTYDFFNIPPKVVPRQSLK